LTEFYNMESQLG